MIQDHKQLLKKLSNLKKHCGVVGVKSSFEDEGVIFNELIKLKELCTILEIDLNIKIGGCEAKSDISNCLLLNVDSIVAPMIESSFALEKYITTVNAVLPPQAKRKIKFFINIESKTAYDNIGHILKSDACRRLSGIVVGRSDLTKSFGLTKNDVNEDEIYTIVSDVFSQAKEYKLITTMGGNVSVNSIDFIGKLYNKGLLDKIETRNIMISLDDAVLNNLESCIIDALSFESLWLRTKSSYYMSIGNSYLNRANILDERK